MKKFLLSLLMVLISASGASAAKKVKYYNAADMSVVCKPQPGKDIYSRVDAGKYPQLSPKAAYYLSFPTGIAVRFKTNSKFIDAKWETNDSLNLSNCSPVAVKGLDIYIKKDGKWMFAGIGKPRYTGKKHSGNMVANMDTTMKECMVYLPTFMELYKLEIGVDPEAKMEYKPGYVRAPIVAIGSSFTHGVSASRPGMAWPAQLSRRLGLDVANYGTSGIQKMETFYADVLADTDADMFVLDCFSNPTPEEIHQRIAPFVEIIRRKHPNTPLVFLQTFTRETDNFDIGKRNFEAKKRKAAEEEMAKLMAKDKHIYFINPGLYAGDDHESSADGVHPTDMGYQRAVLNMEPHIRKIMAKYGIKPGLSAKEAGWGKKK